MQNLFDKTKIIFVVLIVLAVAVGGYFLFSSRNANGPQDNKTNSPIAPEDESLGEEVYEQIENPGEKLPETNPFKEPANPFQETETNPYNEYKNPFE